MASVRRSSAALAVALLAGALSLVGIVAGAPPTAVALGDGGAASLSAGGQTTCAVTSTGAAKCWGAGSSGQLGNGGTSSAVGPVQVSGLTSGVTAISVGGSWACAVVSGAARCWGSNGAGLGDGSSTTSNVPVAVSGLSSDVTAIAVGNLQACAVQGAAVKCWGSGGSGQLGNGGTSNSSVPVQATGLTSGVTGVSVGNGHACAVVSGAAKCWGLNSSRQLGDGTTTSSSTPVQVSGLTSGVESISAGGTHTCAVVSGAAKCWGSGQLGKLGTGSTSTTSTPGQVTGLTSGVTAISAGQLHTCAVTAGSVSCWGTGGSGQLGDGATSNFQQTTPLQVTGLTSGQTAVTAGGAAHTCALGGGVLRCWGDVTSGQLGLYAQSGLAFAPLPMQGLTSGATEVGSYSGGGCAVASGAAKCWGMDQNGSLGAGVANGTQAAVTQVTGLTSGVTAIDHAGTHGCAVASGAATCWGTNFNGQLGNGTTTSASTPVQATGLTSGVTAIDVGPSDTCAVVGGAAKCWGLNTSFQVGVDSPVTVTSPVQVTGLTSGVTDISVGGSSACAVVSGAVKCWGSNIRGELGNGTTTGSSTPVQVQGITSGATAVSVGNGFACAVVTGAVKCWGQGTDGQLGQGSTANSSTPVDATGLGSGVTAISLDISTACAIKDGGAWCWGSNGSGNLGVGDNAGRTVPTRVIGLGANVTAIDAGYTTTCAVVSEAVRCSGSTGQKALAVNFFLPIALLDADVWGVVVNAVPAAANQGVSAPRGIGTHIVLSATDDDHDDLTYTVVDAPSKGTLDCNGTFGEDCIYTAGPNQTGGDSFTFKANDGLADSNTATVTITITNQAPTVDPIAASAPRGIATEIVLTGSDPNTNPITFSKATDPTKGSVSCTSAGVCSYTADPGTTGTDTFTYTASDGAATSAAGTVTITITNQAPSADDRLLDAGRGVPTPVVLSGLDPNGDALTYEIVTPPAKGAVVCDPVGSATCTYTSQASATGSDSFQFRTNDGGLTSPPASVAITLVNAGPTANGQALEAPRGVATPIVLSGADGEGDALTFAVVDQPAKGSLTCGGADGASCSYTAGAGQSGSDSFTFTTSDGTATSTAATVSITITNQAPLANAQTVAANAPLTATPITLTGSDPNGDDLTFAPTTSPAKGSLSCTGASCTYTAAAGKTGVDSFKFTATDPDGASRQATISINLDANTPGVYVGQVDFVEPETGNGTYRSPFIPVMLTTAAPAPVTVWYHTVDGTAVTTGLGGDYREWGTVASPRSITIPAGQTTGYIQPPVFDDDEVEPTEHFDVVVTSLTGGASYLGGTGTTRVNIIDADSLSTGTPILSVLDATQYEGNTGTRMFGFRVVLSKPALAPVKVTCTPISGSAVAGVDFKAGSKTVTINPGAMSAAVDILGYANANQQGIRTFTLSCAIVGAADVNVYRSTATATTAIATILDED